MGDRYRMEGVHEFEIERVGCEVICVCGIQVALWVIGVQMVARVVGEDVLGV